MPDKPNYDDATLQDILVNTMETLAGPDLEEKLEDALQCIYALVEDLQAARKHIKELEHASRQSR